MPNSLSINSLLIVGLLSVGSAPGSVDSVEETEGRGTVETLAGPGFCSGSSDPDFGLARVHALSVQADGSLFFDTGPREKGLVARVQPDGRSSAFFSGSPRGPTSIAATRTAEGLPSAGRIAANGTGGIFVAAGAKILEIDATNALAGVFGDPAVVPGSDGRASSGDGGPVSEARFISARSVTTDENGNLFVVERIDQAIRTHVVRVINRSFESLIFFAGTPRQVIVGPGSLATVAGAARQVISGENVPAIEASIQGDVVSLAVAGSRLYLGLSKADGENLSPEVRLVNLGGEVLQAHGQTVAPGGIRSIAGKGRRGFRGDGGQARSAAFSYLPGLAADTTGSLYVADEFNHRIRKIDPSGVVSTVVGTGAVGNNRGAFNGNHRPAKTARLDRPFDVKTGSGGIYIADQLNNQVRVVDEAGVIRAAPGSGIASASRCVSEPASKASHKQSSEVPIPGNPTSLDVDPRENVFFTLPSTNQIKRLSPAGRVTNVAGRTAKPCHGDCQSFGGDGGPARKAALDSPSALTLDREANIYFADNGNSRIRFINRSSRNVRAHGVTVGAGSVETVAGTGEPPSTNHGSDAGSPAKRALATRLGTVSALAVDATGSLLVAETGSGGLIRRIRRDGSISIFAGNGASGALSKCCTGPTGVAFNAQGDLYVSDLVPDTGAFKTPRPRVWLVNMGTRPTLQHGKATRSLEAVVVAGNGDVGFAGEGGDATEAELLIPQGITADSRENLYIAGGAGAGMAFTGDIRKVDSTGKISVIAGSGPFGFNGDGMKAKLTSVIPAGLAADRCDNLLIADQGNDRIRRINISGACPPEAITESTRRPLPLVPLAGLFLAILGVLAVSRWLRAPKPLT